MMTPRSPEPVFQRNLYAGTAADYDRYRPGYPAALGEWIRSELALDGTGALLDLGAGTGHVARLLRPGFARVLAVDAETDMAEFGRKRSEREGDGIAWMLGRAEELEFSDESFDAVSAGSAFHRFDRPVVAAKAASWLKPDGAVILLWGRSLHEGETNWQRALARVFAEAVAASGRVPAGWERKDYPDEVVLREAGFARIETNTVNVPLRWTVDDILGYLRSTSFASRAATGDRSSAFEDSVRRTLLEADDRGVYEQDAEFGGVVARR
jgi:SAM-dependent methyltransferase